MGSNDSPNEVDDSEADPSPNKIACFKLNVQSNNTWVLDPNLAEYVKKFIQSFNPRQTVTEHILGKNPVPTNIKG